MNDFAFCKGGNCPFKSKCMRHTAIPKKPSRNNVMWWVDPAYDKEVNKCRLFYKIRKELY